MNEHAISAEQESFKDFLLKNRRNRAILWIAAVVIAIQFAIFKYLYPFASFIHGDSFSYIGAAYNNLSINTYPIGYSKFLRLFSVFAKPDYLLVAFQYLFIQCSVLFLSFTIFYFYMTGKVIQIILLCFMVFNPLFLYLANLVSSDGFFLALSCIWFALLLWIMNRHSTKIVLWHAIILFIAFTVRYNAIIYPLIAILAFGLSSLPLRKKALGVGLGLILCGWFVGFNMYNYKKLTGNWQFSPFSGWLLTNNAMYAYRFVEKADRKVAPDKFRVFDNMVRQYVDSTRDIKKFPHELLQASTVYMWSDGSPMYKYQKMILKQDSTSGRFKRWAMMGPFYKSYGSYIIKTYTWQFFKHFVWPNAKKYYAPPVEYLGKYNSDKDKVAPIAKEWFGYKDDKVRTRTKDKKIKVLNIYPILSGIVNVVMLAILLCFILLKGVQSSSGFKKGIISGASVWLINAVFTIYASSAALRFQSFPILLTTIFVGLLLDWLWKVAMISEVTSLKTDFEDHTSPAQQALA